MNTEILITCPPMLIEREHAQRLCTDNGWKVHCADVVQTLTEEQLLELVPRFDGWIAGDDPATREVLAAAQKGRLKALVKWGVGTDNIDKNACEDLGLGFAHTPAMFSDEVADVALAYLILLTRQIHVIDAAVKEGRWIKPQGRSLRGKRAALVGFGNIGRAIAARLHVCGVSVTAYDPHADAIPADVPRKIWPEGLSECDIVIFSSALTPETMHMCDRKAVESLRPGSFVVNVSRGGLIDEAALIQGLAAGKIAAAALDVFEQEPLPIESPLRDFPQCVFGSHNASNTLEAVRRTNERAVDAMQLLLAE